ncbi:unnamed protein product, partial [Didymodactylos carnosus]
ATKKMAKSKDEFLDEILMCGICLSRMKQPRSLPCMHSFCQQCLIEFVHNSTNSIDCPYCKLHIEYNNFAHFQSMLLVNPVLKQLCEALDSENFTSSKFDDSNTSSSTTNNNASHARCHTCGLLKLLKVCKHCFFMLCQECRKQHLLEVHSESKHLLEQLEYRLKLVQTKKFELDQQLELYDQLKRQTNDYAL